jgi:hypothetical protein
VTHNAIVCNITIAFVGKPEKAHFINLTKFKIKISLLNHLTLPKELYFLKSTTTFISMVKSIKAFFTKIGVYRPKKNKNMQIDGSADFSIVGL